MFRCGDATGARRRATRRAARRIVGQSVSARQPDLSPASRTGSTRPETAGRESYHRPAKKITIIFGRKVTKQYKGKLQTVIEDLELPNPMIRSHYGKGFLKQYVRDHLCLRTEPATNDVTDYGVKKAVENLPQLRDKLATIATIISPSSRTSWKPLSTEANCVSWQNPQCFPVVNGFPA